MLSRRERAFTLLELLLVLALLALLTGVLVVGSARSIQEKPVTAESVFWKAVMETRKQALQSASEVRLTFSPAKGRETPAELTATSRDGVAMHFPYEGGGQLVIDFLSTQKNRSAILVGGEAVETNTMPAVTFYGDGTCTPFRAQLRTGGAARFLNIDPWTCAPVLAVNPQR